MMAEKSEKMFKRAVKQREEEFVPQQDPNRPYKRKYQKTRMPWQLEILQQGRWDILAVYLLFWVGIIALIGVVAYYTIMIMIEHIAPILFPPAGVILPRW